MVLDVLDAVCESYRTGQPKSSKRSLQGSIDAGRVFRGGAVSESGEATLREGCFGTVRAGLLHRSSNCESRGWMDNQSVPFVVQGWFFPPSQQVPGVDPIVDRGASFPPDFPAPGWLTKTGLEIS